MAYVLSRRAKLHVADLLNGHDIDRLAKDWQGIYRIYHSESPFRREVLPRPEYVLSREVDICCEPHVSKASLDYLFSEGPPAELWYALPRRIISSIVQVRAESGSHAKLSFLELGFFTSLGTYSKGRVRKMHAYFCSAILG